VLLRRNDVSLRRSGELLRRKAFLSWNQLPEAFFMAPAGAIGTAGTIPLSSRWRKSMEGAWQVARVHSSRGRGTVHPMSSGSEIFVGDIRITTA
jgi:hypothetical protein